MWFYGDGQFKMASGLNLFNMDLPKRWVAVGKKKYQMTFPCTENSPHSWVVTLANVFSNLFCLFAFHVLVFSKKPNTGKTN
jgi:hypothetical protein